MIDTRNMKKCLSLSARERIRIYDYIYMIFIIEIFSINSDEVYFKNYIIFCT